MFFVVHSKCNVSWSSSHCQLIKTWMDEGYNLLIAIRIAISGYFHRHILLQYRAVAPVIKLVSPAVLRKTLFTVTENVTFSIVHFQTHSVCSATNNKLSIYVNQINRISIQTACSCVLPSSSSPNVIRNINSWFSNLVVQRKKTRMMRLAQHGSDVELHFINSHN